MTRVTGITQAYMEVQRGSPSPEHGRRRMTRRLILGPDQVTKIRHDMRYVAAKRSDVKTDPAWRARGACLSVDPGTFFPEPQDEVSAAVALCKDCPVAGACLAAALNTAEPEGIWGGTTPSERRAMRVVWTGRC